MAIPGFCAFVGGYLLRIIGLPKFVDHILATFAIIGLLIFMGRHFIPLLAFLTTRLLLSEAYNSVYPEQSFCLVVDIRKLS